MKLTGKEINLAEDVFKLKDLLEAKLLVHREAVEEIANSAVKEESIENKLKVQYILNFKKFEFVLERSNDLFAY